MPFQDASIGYASSPNGQVRNLASSLRRLRAVAETIEGANDRSQQFLDALVGQSREGQKAGTGTPVEQATFVSELHRLIDRVESAALAASSHSCALLAAADDGQSTSTLTASELMSGQYVERRIAEQDPAAVEQYRAGRAMNAEKHDAVRAQAIQQEYAEEASRLRARPAGGGLGALFASGVGTIQKPDPDHKIG